MRQAPSAVNAALNAAPVATFVTFFSEGISKGVVCLRFGARVPARTSTSELGCFYAIEHTQVHGQRRVDGVGRLKFDFHTGPAPRLRGGGSSSSD